MMCKTPISREPPSGKQLCKELNVTSIRPVIIQAKIKKTARAIRRPVDATAHRGSPELEEGPLSPLPQTATT
eukprot:444788-Amphidinium_carterae.1